MSSNELSPAEQSAPERPAPEPTESLSVVSWNIQFGVEVEAAIKDLVRTPELRDADIILLQEMDEAGTAQIAESVGLDYVYASPAVHAQSGRHFGNAVLAPWPVGEPEVAQLSYKSAVRGQPRVLVRTTVTVGNTPIGACSVHTEVPSLSSAKRLRQFDEVAAAASRSPGERLVIGGDFNTLTKRGVKALTDRMASIGAARVTGGAGATLRRGGQEFTLDHVFARGLEPVAAGVVTGSAASDHRPLWVRLRSIGRDGPSSDSPGE